MRTQVEEDAFLAWTHALNCLLYENDPGPRELNTGTADEPGMIPCTQAYQHAYALLVLVECEADHARLTGAARQCRAEITGLEGRLWEARIAELARAADLCEQAAKTVEDARGVSDGRARPAASSVPTALCQSRVG